MAFVQVKSPLGGTVPVEVADNPLPLREEVERTFWQLADEIRKLPGGEEALARYEELARTRYLSVRDEELGSLVATAPAAREDTVPQYFLAKEEYPSGLTRREVVFAYGEVGEDGTGIAGLVFLKRQEAGDVDPVLFRTDGENLYVAATRRTISPGETEARYLVESLPLEEVRGYSETLTPKEKAVLVARHIAEELGREPMGLTPLTEREVREQLAPSFQGEGPAPAQELRQGGVVRDERGNPVGAYDLVIELRDLNGDGRVEPTVTKIQTAAMEFGEVGASWAFSESVEARQVREGLRSPGQDEETLSRYDSRVEERMRVGEEPERRAGDIEPRL